MYSTYSEGKSNEELWSARDYDEEGGGEVDCKLNASNASCLRNNKTGEGKNIAVYLNDALDAADKSSPLA